MDIGQAFQRVAQVECKLLQIEKLQKMLAFLLHVQAVLLIMCLVNLWALLSNMTNPNIIDGCTTFAVILIVAFNIIMLIYVYIRRKVRRELHDVGEEIDELIVIGKELRKQFSELKKKE